MLRSLNELDRYKVAGTDGIIGTAINFLLDDERWVVRYLVVQTGGLFENRRVLISPTFIRDAEWANKTFHLALTKEKVENSPSVDMDQPVSRQREQDYHRYYDFAAYWGYTGGLWGMGPTPDALAHESWNEGNALPPEQAAGDVHLRSARDIRGYEIQGSDGAVGRVGDFIVDEDTWAVRYLMIDTGNWWRGKKVLVAPEWASRVSWEEGKVYVALSRQRIKNSPEWNGTAAINREFEQRMYDYYGRPVYWADGDHPEPIPRSHPSADAPR